MKSARSGRKAIRRTKLKDGHMNHVQKVICAKESMWKRVRQLGGLCGSNEMKMSSTSGTQSLSFGFRRGALNIFEDIFELSKCFGYFFPLMILASLLPGPAFAAQTTPLGANKFDLAMQYEGFAGWNSEGSADYRHVTHAMGLKAIRDARDAGFKFFRVGVGGYGADSPQSFHREMLRLWQSNPEAYWRLIDQMFDDMDAEGLQIVPTLLWSDVQFPAMTGETTVDLIRDKNSASRKLASKYISDFIKRYRSRKTILFYELTNEFNLDADLDMHQRCLNQKHEASQCVFISNFTQGELDAFATDMVDLIRQLDPDRKISSGYGMPQPWARHMSEQPEWTHQKGFRPDSPAEFADNLATIHRMFDIVSVHVYPQTVANRYGRAASSQSLLIEDAAKAAHAAHKKLFLGEFGDSGPTPFMQSIKALMEGDKIDYAAVWIWEFYQKSTFETKVTPPSQFSLEPGYSDALIELLERPHPLTAAEKPRIVLNWPLPCARVNAPVQIHATASDGAVPVESVEFFVDGVSIGAASTPPYRVTWNPSGAGARLAHLSAVARTKTGAASSDSNDVLVNTSAQTCQMPTD